MCSSILWFCCECTSTEVIDFDETYQHYLPNGCWAVPSLVATGLPLLKKKENNHIKMMEFFNQQFFTVAQNFYVTPCTFSTCQHGWPTEAHRQIAMANKKVLFLLWQARSSFFPTNCTDPATGRSHVHGRFYPFLVFFAPMEEILTHPCTRQAMVSGKFESGYFPAPVP